MASCIDCSRGHAKQFFLCASLHSESRYDERRSVSESREAPKIWKDFGSYEKPSQRLLCGMVGQALSEETSTFQANGMGLGNQQRYGGCYTVQGISTEVLRMSRQESDHNLQLAASTSHLLIERLGDRSQRVAYH